MNMYFGNFVTAVSTLMVCALIAYIIYTAVKQKKIEHWGRRIALLAFFGLVTCCFVAVRDGYVLSVNASIDSAVKAGLFKIDSLQSTLCCIGGAIIAFSSISSIFVKNPKYRKAMFFVLSAAIIFKTLVVEISRWLV
ncbi:hypothetical protein [Ethanoligenens sp.]|uniref:hypothetical protein n=1 Tax=Ethanoligenens sp. TaxID=2099655 RepID=UPI0039E8367F